MGCRGTTDNEERYPKLVLYLLELLSELTSTCIDCTKNYVGDKYSRKDVICNIVWELK